jgi:hypothetical protein
MRQVAVMDEDWTENPVIRGIKNHNENAHIIRIERAEVASLSEASSTQGFFSHGFHLNRR